MWLCVENGWDFVVKGGSYEGQIRKQLESVMVIIDNPGHRPLAPIMPPGLPPPTDDDKIAEYCERYLLSDRKTENEVYTYGEFIVKQLDHIIAVLNKAQGNTNQARFAIGDVYTTHLSDPPCLNSIQMKVVEGKLNMAVTFRSWDLFAGFPENLGGLQMLKEYILAHLTFPCEDGKIIAFSDGLHLYEMYEDLVNSLNWRNKMKKDLTEVVMILDESGSMEGLTAETYSWEFVFLAQNIDAHAAALQIGSAHNMNSRVYQAKAGAEGYLDQMVVASAACSSYRSTGNAINISGQDAGNIAGSN